MPDFSQNLDQSLHRALAIAEESRHQQATEGHLLLALIDDPDAVTVMRACEVNLDRLRRAISLSLSTLEDGQLADGTGLATSSSFRTVVQRAVIHVQSIRGDRAVTGADVLTQMFTEGAVAEILREHGMTRYDVTRFISHGIAKGDRLLHGRAG
jgi:ATP-dependent Clp protease ATP-binding subunit ClpA